MPWLTRQAAPLCPAAGARRAPLKKSKLTQQPRLFSILSRLSFACSQARDAHPSKKSKLTRDRDRDVGEKMALGMAAVGGAAGGDVQYDARLFNQDAGSCGGAACKLRGL